MKTLFCRLLVLAGAGTGMLWPCSCEGVPACGYPSADVIFLGRVTFTNHDPAAGPSQFTLVRFEVEESFKGIEPGVHEIWVDPGSFTSCYEIHPLYNRYLIRGTRLTLSPQATAELVMTRDDWGRVKPVPPGFNLAAPPPIYLSPECTDIRADNSPGFQQDLAILRAYRSGVPMPRILGDLHLFPFSGWPQLDGPPLTGAAITISNGSLVLKTRTDETGRFWIQDAPSGDYTVRAELPPYQVDPVPHSADLHVPEAGCGYTEVRLATTSAIQGVVLYTQGRGAARIPVTLRLKEDSSKGVNDDPTFHDLSTTSDDQGRFTISGVPDADFYLFAGDTYQAVYYPNGDSLASASKLRLRPGERRESIVLRLRPPLRPQLQLTRVKVQVVDMGGRPEIVAGLNLYQAGSMVWSETITGKHGLGSVSCSRGLEYELEAAAVHPRPDGRPEVIEASRVPFVCGDRAGPIVLRLDHRARGTVAGQIADSKGLPLGNPLLRIYRERETTPICEVHGDEKGQFRINDVEAGDYTIEIAVQGLGEKTMPDVHITRGLNDLGVVIWI